MGRCLKKTLSIVERPEGKYPSRIKTDKKTDGCITAAQI